MTDAHLVQLEEMVRRPVTPRLQHLEDSNMAALARSAIPQLIAEIRQLRAHVATTAKSKGRKR